MLTPGQAGCRACAVLGVLGEGKTKGCPISAEGRLHEKSLNGELLWESIHSLPSSCHHHPHSLCTEPLWATHWVLLCHVLSYLTQLKSHEEGLFIISIPWMSKLRLKV